MDILYFSKLSFRLTLILLTSLFHVNAFSYREEPPHSSLILLGAYHYREEPPLLYFMLTLSMTWNDYYNLTRCYFVATLQVIFFNSIHFVQSLRWKRLYEICGTGGSRSIKFVLNANLIDIGVPWVVVPIMASPPSTGGVTTEAGGHEGGGGGDGLVSDEDGGCGREVSSGGGGGGEFELTVGSDGLDALGSGNEGKGNCNGDGGE
ncbi:hypothetical protein L1887_22759 [Cichorium endivia]|nr:hypothetical protein L1887_22759 [Cichorium endivia]